MKRIVKGTLQNWSDAKLNYWSRVSVFVCVWESVRQKTQKLCPKYYRSPLFRRQYFTIVVLPISRSSSVNDTCSRATDTNTTADHHFRPTLWISLWTVLIGYSRFWRVFFCRFCSFRWAFWGWCWRSVLHIHKPIGQILHLKIVFGRQQMLNIFHHPR